MPDAPLDVLDPLAGGGVTPSWSSLSELWGAYAIERGAGRSPWLGAARVAARADRLGHAFAVGYPAALECLVPGVVLPCALCATEAEGNSPRAITTMLTQVQGAYRLDGVKTFVTFGTLAVSLIIVARIGDKPDGRPDLTVVRIPSDRDGVTLRELPPISFVPEVTHARLELDDVFVDPSERLPGDGYLRYLKPFRTIEDIHVIGATAAYAIGWARRVGASAKLVARLSANLVALGALSSADPLDPRTHVALHGCYQSVIEALRGDAFAELLGMASEPERERWRRDEKLLSVASKARHSRFVSATRALGLDKDELA